MLAGKDYDLFVKFIEMIDSDAKVVLYNYDKDKAIRHEYMVPINDKVISDVLDRHARVSSAGFYNLLTEYNELIMNDIIEEKNVLADSKEMKNIYDDAINHSDTYEKAIQTVLIGLFRETFDIYFGEDNAARCAIKENYADALREYAVKAWSEE